MLHSLKITIKLLCSILVPTEKLKYSNIIHLKKINLSYVTKLQS